ncbi:flavin reductase family protein [Brevundimonas sp. AJA228-03]|uniref:flavin reductase family protein n=1 Tax=Brevundimonas sp. AJA228-03 TaxID=2752515 RepID=UPI001ADEEB8B|nr:flavin reductase family protein [Brevundimonas sp. AJA228-03]QTN18507.1 flavin reductase family protein [Brevundimonas sp. AJA228-03]
MSLEPLSEEAVRQADASAYRRALGAFATGVCVVTADSEAGPLGITINSFTSVSLTPRLVLWCLDERSERWAPFSAAEAFSIHVLDAGSQALSNRFARGVGLLSDGEFLRVGNAPPRLSGAVARFDCRTYQRVQMGDHMTIVGEVEGFEASDGPTLTYFRGRYGTAEDA